jgi:glucokinase
VLFRSRQAQRLLRENTFENSLLKNYPLENITAHEIFDAWSKNDALAVHVINRAMQFWGMASANIVSLLNPEVIIWGGGVFGPGAQLLDKIYEEACRWAQPIAIKQVRFEQSQLGGDAGLIGAGRLVIV